MLNEDLQSSADASTQAIETRYQWSEVPTIGDVPGIYAWYYMPEITQFDIGKLIESVHCHISKGDRAAGHKQIETFLEQFIFSYFSEEPYETIMRGPLKPTYEGQLHHRPSVSAALIERLLDDPERLRTVKAVLETSAPDFASPIYIGMSEKLGRRLKHHRKLIEKYRAKRPEATFTPVSEPKTDQRDQSFARQIAEREINPQRLFVMIRLINAGTNHYVDLENILNRIHYPLLGRN
ncbi:MAG: hypothetical protein EA407_06325 [Rhodobacteraceae bacterium]|nr:MAG: hypothetical protein EA407_06325 [Paracoccaceae bacterium]